MMFENTGEKQILLFCYIKAWESKTLNQKACLGALRSKKFEEEEAYLLNQNNLYPRVQRIMNMVKIA